MVVVLAWLKEALMRGISRKKLLEHLQNTYTKARIEQLFNIIIKFLTSSLKQVLDAKLLHPCPAVDMDKQAVGEQAEMNSLLHTVDGGCPELQTQAFPVNSLILSAQFWPQFKAECLEFPHEVTEAMVVIPSLTNIEREQNLGLEASSWICKY